MSATAPTVYGLDVFYAEAARAMAVNGSNITGAQTLNTTTGYQTYDPVTTTLGAPVVTVIDDCSTTTAWSTPAPGTVAEASGTVNAAKTSAGANTLTWAGSVTPGASNRYLVVTYPLAGGGSGVVLYDLAAIAGLYPGFKITSIVFTDTTGAAISVDQVALYDHAPATPETYTITPFKVDAATTALALQTAINNAADYTLIELQRSPGYTGDLNITSTITIDRSNIWIKPAAAGTSGGPGPAINAAGLAAGAPVFKISGGTTTAPINNIYISDLTLTGGARSNTLVTTTANVNGIQIARNTSTTTAIYSGNASNALIVDNLAVLGEITDEVYKTLHAKSSGSGDLQPCINLTGGSQIAVGRNTIKGFMVGIQFGNVNGVSIFGNQISLCGNYDAFDVSYSDSGGIWGSNHSTNVLAYSNWIAGTCDVGLDFEHDVTNCGGFKNEIWDSESGNMFVRNKCVNVVFDTNYENHSKNGTGTQHLGTRAEDGLHDAGIYAAVMPGDTAVGDLHFLGNVCDSTTQTIDLFEGDHWGYHCAGNVGAKGSFINSYNGH